MASTRCCAVPCRTFCPGPPSFRTILGTALCSCRCALRLLQDLIKYSLPHDVWFHVDALSSAHVYLRLPEGAFLLPFHAKTRCADTRLWPLHAAACLCL